MDTILITCPTCGVVIHADPAAHEIACWYCGSRYTVQEENLGATLDNLGFHQAEEELSVLRATKEQKLKELSRMIRSFFSSSILTLTPLIRRRTQLETDILDLSKTIHRKQNELAQIRCSMVAGQMGD